MSLFGHKLLSEAQVRRLIAFFVGANGIWVLLTALIVRLHHLGSPFPVRTQILSRDTSIIIGLFLIYFAFQLRQGKRSAWWLAFFGTLGILLLPIVHDRLRLSVLILIPSLALLIALVASKDVFRVRNDIVSLKRGALISATILGLALAYGTIGFLLLDRPDFHTHDFSFIEALARTVQQYTLIGNDDLHPHTLHALWFLNSLSVMGVGSFVLVALTFFLPLRFHFRPSHADYATAQSILKLRSDSPEDFFKIWPQDKHFFFNAQRTALIAYRVELGVALALGDPMGPDDDIRNLLADFLEHCRMNGWSAAFVHATPKYLRFYKEAKLKTVKIGQEAFVDLDEFVETTTRNKHFRYINNKFSREGYIGELLRPPYDTVFLKQLRQISDQWLMHNHRQERRFALGYFDERYLNQCQLYVVRDAKSQIVAFTNLIPVSTPGSATVDLMRFGQTAPKGIMNYVFLELLRTLHSDGTRRFNLGIAPLAGLGKQEKRSLPEDVLRFIRAYGARFYSFKGLEQFKSKFEPDWEDSYIIYQGTPIKLIQISVALIRATRIGKGQP